MTKRLLFVLLAVPALALAAPSGTDAGESLPVPGTLPQGEVPLSEPIAPVPSRNPSWNLGLSFLGGVADPFWDKVAVMGSVRRGFGRWAVEGFGGRAFSWAAAGLDLCRTQASCTQPGALQLGATPGQLDWLGGLAGVYRIGNAKLSFGGLEAVRFSLEGSVGAAAVGYQVNDGKLHSVFGPGARLGLGLGMGVGDGITARVELQNLLYMSDIRGNADLERQLFLGASVAWQPGGTR